MPFFNRKKEPAPQPALVVDRAAPEEGSWEPATVFYAHQPTGVVHLVVRPATSDGLIELDAHSDIVPVELREPNSRVEVLLAAGRILGVRGAGPGAASWFAQSRELQTKGCG